MLLINQLIYGEHAACLGGEGLDKKHLVVKSRK
jgi:hypothetical protein